MDRIALISDTHGNLTALEAVLADIRARGIERIFNLGDSAGKGPRGAATTALCRELCEVNIRGNWDDQWSLITDADAAEMVWWRDDLAPEAREWLGALPLSVDLVISGRQVRLFHATPVSPHVRMWGTHTSEQFASMFVNTELTGAGPEPDVVGYGDIHYAYLEAADGRTLLNVGSVGNPMDEPRASYVILEGVVDGVAGVGTGAGGSGTRAGAGAGVSAPFGIQFVRVAYDVEAEVAVAERLGMPTLEPWAIELRTSLYRGLQQL